MKLGKLTLLCTIRFCKSLLMVSCVEYVAKCIYGELVPVGWGVIRVIWPSVFVNWLLVKASVWLCQRD